ncbi:membrane protein [Klebsiella pneumoniae]|uniref:Membrane protein n=1 Tax=Klebsiella pneumoniae TaxID=573 RepID=A0A377TT44_KLEPN|nr:membrane protein [Klebsiella pneumoniae]
MQLTNFDLILLLIISEATQQAMLSTDYSVTGSMLTIVTLVSIDILFGYIKKKICSGRKFSRWYAGYRGWKMVLSSTRRLSSSISLSMISCWRPGSTMAFMN